MCEGCGQGICPPAGSSGSKSWHTGPSGKWKCGPCVRSLEASYLRALENLEKEYETKLQKNLAVGVRNFQLQEEMQKRGYEIEKLTLLLHEAESKLTAGDSLIQQLAAQLSDGRLQHRRMVELQNEIMTDNSRLHGSAQTAGTELERTSHTVRDLEHANQVLRDENQALSDRVRALLDAVAGLREELRASFHGQEAAAAQATAERREWREAQRALETEADDLRRRLRWLEEGTASRPSAGPPAAAFFAPRVGDRKVGNAAAPRR
jgi:chromosome segregation ATPase